MPAPEGAAQPGSVTVHLVDLEPLAGLVAVCARFNAALTAEAVNALPDNAVEAISQMQSILWRLEHSRIEQVPDGG